MGPSRPHTCIICATYMCMRLYRRTPTSHIPARYVSRTAVFAKFASGRRIRSRSEAEKHKKERETLGEKRSRLGESQSADVDRTGDAGPGRSGRPLPRLNWCSSSSSSNSSRRGSPSLTPMTFESALVYGPTERVARAGDPNSRRLRSHINY